MLKLKEENYLYKILIELDRDEISDIHLKSGCKIYYRMLGDIKVLEDSEILNDNLIVSFLAGVLNAKIKEDFKENKQADFAFSSSNDTRYRANLFKTSTGYSLSLRRISNRMMSFEELMLPPIIKNVAELEKGLVIMAGATGSGKSTTLTAIVDYINSKYEKHIITLEDPIEFIHQNKKSLINQREIGVDAKSFSLGLKSALREDPDVILIGEIRDSESIKECLRSAETGHLVFATLHTQSAAKSIDRIIDSCEASEKELVRTMLSTTLQAVISQKLLKRKNINGKDGRVVAYEILLGTTAVRNLIKENKIVQIESMLQTGKKFGMVDMQTCINNLFEKGLISIEELEKNTYKLGGEINEQ